MPSIESKLDEHLKYKKQCDARVKSGAQLVLVSILASVLLTWFVPWFWKLGLAWVVYVCFSTFMEHLSSKKHAKAILELSNT